MSIIAAGRARAVDIVSQSFHMPMEMNNKCGETARVRPFIHAYMPKWTLKPLDLVEMRRRLPLRIGVVVERELGDGQFVVSTATPERSLATMTKQYSELFNEHVRCGDINLAKDHFDNANDEEATTKKNNEIEAGLDLLYKPSGGELVYRARVFGHEKEHCAIRLLDYNTFARVHIKNLYPMRENFVRGANRFAFTTRVTLPPAAVTSAIGLPNSECIRAGDRLVLILLTPTEPHLAVVGGFAESVMHSLRPDRLIAGLTPTEQTKWKSMLDEPTPASHGPVALLKGYGQPSNVEYHRSRLAIVVAVEALDRVHVRDLASATRLPFMQEWLANTYACKTTPEMQKRTERFGYVEIKDIKRGMSAVALSTTKDDDSVYRVEVTRVLNASAIEVRHVDYPNRANVTVTMEQLCQPLACLDIPPLVFNVAMAMHGAGVERVHFSQLAACIIPDGTPVVLNTAEKTGLVRISCASAPNGVLEEIGFDEFAASQPRKDKATDCPAFGSQVFRSSRPEMADALVGSYQTNVLPARRPLPPLRKQTAMVQKKPQPTVPEDVEMAIEATA